MHVREVAVIGRGEDDQGARAENSKDAGKDVEPLVPTPEGTRDPAKVTQPAFGEECERVCDMYGAISSGSRSSSRWYETDKRRQ
jgi:hypothetical protein